MKKLLFLLSIFAIVLSCSSDETSTPATPPPAPIVKYTITLSSGEGGTVSTTGGEYEAGQTVSVTATPQGEYVFKSWSDGNTNATRTITVSSNSTLTANFEKKKYPLTVNIEGEGEVLEEIVNAGRTTDYDSGTTVKLTAVPAEGWEFAGWTGAIDSNELEVQLLVSEAKEINAEFKVSISTYFFGEILLDFPSNKNINEIIPNRETDRFKISEIGWMGLEINERHSGGAYGTNPLPPGRFDFSTMNYVKIDFNGDSYEDILFTVEIFPHTINKTSNMGFLALINNQDGTFSYGNYLLDAEILRANHPYRIESADFNGDGIKDFIASNQGKNGVSDEGSTYVKAALPILALSNLDGSYTYSTKSNMIGMNPGDKFYEDYDNDEVPDWLWHETASVGDFDNDGDIDIFLTTKIFYNDGKGNFTIDGFQFSEELIKTNHPYSSKVKDLTNDGFADLIYSPSESKKLFVLLSQVSNEVYSYKKLEMPAGFYGDGTTNFNVITTIDLNNDNYQDILVGTTRINPYYEGSTLQLFINNQGLSFEDKTLELIGDQSSFDNYSGQGFIDVLDFDNDGDLDVIHQTASRSYPTNGSKFYINNNGVLDVFDNSEMLPYIGWRDFQGFEHFYDDPQFNNTDDRFSVFPVRINNSGWVDFISVVSQKVGIDKTPYNLFYTIESKN
jgi:hypothetical protein